MRTKKKEQKTNPKEIISEYDKNFAEAVNKMLPQMIQVIETDFDQDLPQEKQKAVIEAKKMAVETYVTVRAKLIEIIEATQPQQKSTDDKQDVLSRTEAKNYSADDFV